MDSNKEKCVMVISDALPRGLAANTAAILGITLGRTLPEVVGTDVTDQSGRRHPGIIQFPIPILKGTPESIKQLRQKLFRPEYQGLTSADFSDLAQSCKTYDEFITRMGSVPEADLCYLGIVICGEAKKVNQLTGNLPLLR